MVRLILAAFIAAACACGDVSHPTDSDADGGPVTMTDAGTEDPPEPREPSRNGALSSGASRMSSTSYRLDGTLGGWQAGAPAEGATFTLRPSTTH